MKKKTTLAELIKVAAQRVIKEAFVKEAPVPQADGADSDESPATQQAHKLDLTGKPYGMFADKTGKVVAKSVDGGNSLVKIEPKDNNPDGLAGDPLSGNKPEKAVEPSTKLKDMVPKSQHPQDHEAIPADKATAQAKLVAPQFDPKTKIRTKDTEPDYDPYAADAKTTLKHQKPQYSSKAEKAYNDKKNAPDARPAKAAATLMDKIKDVEKAKTWAAAKMVTYEKAGDTKNAVYFGEILKNLAKAEKAVEVPQDVKDTVRDTTAFSRAATPTSDMNAKIDKGIEDMNNDDDKEPKISSWLKNMSSNWLPSAKPDITIPHGGEDDYGSPDWEEAEMEREREEERWGAEDYKADWIRAMEKDNPPDTVDDFDEPEPSSKLKDLVPKPKHKDFDMQADQGYNSDDQATAAKLIQQAGGNVDKAIDQEAARYAETKNKKPNMAGYLHHRKLAALLAARDNTPKQDMEPYDYKADRHKAPPTPWVPPKAPKKEGYTPTNSVVKFDDDELKTDLETGIQ